MAADNIIRLRRRSFVGRLFRLPRVAYMHFQLLGRYRKYPLPLVHRIKVSVSLAAIILR